MLATACADVDTVGVEEVKDLLDLFQLNPAAGTVGHWVVPGVGFAGCGKIGSNHATATMVKYYAVNTCKYEPLLQRLNNTHA